MLTSPRTSLLRAPLAVVALFVLALLALYPGASLRAQSAPAGAGAVPAAPASDSVTTDGEVVDMVLKGKQVEVVYKNTGTVSTRVIGELQVRDADGEVVGALAFVEGKLVEPGKTERFRATMPTVAAGKYTLWALVQFGGPALAAAQAELEILP